MLRYRLLREWRLETGAVFSFSRSSSIISSVSKLRLKLWRSLWRLPMRLRNRNPIVTRGYLERTSSNAYCIVFVRFLPRPAIFHFDFKTTARSRLYTCELHKITTFSFGTCGTGSCSLLSPHIPRLRLGNSLVAFSITVITLHFLMRWPVSRWYPSVLKLCIWDPAEGSSDCRVWRLWPSTLRPASLGLSYFALSGPEQRSITWLRYIKHFVLFCFILI